MTMGSFSCYCTLMLSTFHFWFRFSPDCVLAPPPLRPRIPIVPRPFGVSPQILPWGAMEGHDVGSLGQEMVRFQQKKQSTNNKPTNQQTNNQQQQQQQSCFEGGKSAPRWGWSSPRVPMAMRWPAKRSGRSWKSAVGEPSGHQWAMGGCRSQGGGLLCCSEMIYWCNYCNWDVVAKMWWSEAGSRSYPQGESMVDQGYVIWSLAGVYLLLVCCFFDRIRLAIAVNKVAATFVCLEQVGVTLFCDIFQ